MQLLAQEVQLGWSPTTTTSTPADIFIVATTPQNTENTTSCSVLFQMIHRGVQPSCTRCLALPFLPFQALFHNVYIAPILSPGGGDHPWGTDHRRGKWRVWVNPRRRGDPGALKALQEQKGSHFNCSFKRICSLAENKLAQLVTAADAVGVRDSGTSFSWHRVLGWRFPLFCDPPQF